MEQVPANRGYTGDLYTQLARRYEKACAYTHGGSLTILAATTMPGDDVTHPVPDNTGYITEGQFYLRGGMIDPFGSLSRLKQHVAGVTTREDHKDIMNAMVRLYADAKEAEQKQSMAFELSEHDTRALTFGRLFRERFMDLEVDMALEDALDLCWQTLAECFRPEELFIKQELIDRYLPDIQAGDAQGETEPGPEASRPAEAAAQGQSA
jgi:V/A-type H+-transporting ATPase subunit B